MNLPPATATKREANWRFALESPVHLLALGFGSGLSPIAPGTAGSLMGWACYWLLASRLSDTTWAILLLAGFAFGAWASGKTALALGTDDPSPVVWDEIIAIWLVLWLLQTAPGTPATWGLQAVGFALFRLFDAVKRGPVGWADHHIKGGLGIMVDDIVAAILTLACVFGARLALAWGQTHGL